MRLIDADALMESMYHTAFETDGDSMWNSGLWVRYRAIERVVNEQPTVQPEIIYCKDCKWKQGAECVRFADVRPFPNDFCSRAERREE